MYAYTMVDYFNEPGFVKFYSERPNVLQKTGVFASIEEDPYRLAHVLGGAYHNGDYYAYKVDMYTFVTYVRDFITVDLETGVYTSVMDLSEKKDDWDFIDGMASNNATGDLMAVARARIVEENQEPTSTIGYIDTNTGEYTIEAELNEYYFSIAYDYDGVLYAIRWKAGKNGDVVGSYLVTLDPNDNYKELTKLELKKDGIPFKMYYHNSLVFDYTTGDLWCLACNTDARQSLNRINLETGVLEGNGGFGYSEIGLGLYIPYEVADARDAAFRVSELTSDFRETDGSVVLKWVNPSKTWNGLELPELAEVKIFRDNVEVATVPAENNVGKPMSWTDESAEKGVHTYKVVACRRPGELGIPAYWDAFAGRDIPGPVTDLAISGKDNRISLTWNAPVRGENDGWIDKSSLKYRITRYPDKVVVAEGQTNTSFEDVIDAEMDYFSYGIVAFNNDGEGFEVVSDGLLVGAAYSIPYNSVLDTEVEANRWVIDDANKDGNTYKFIDWGYLQGLQLETTATGADDYAISPRLKMKGNTTYRIKFNIYFQNCWDEQYYPNHFHNLSIVAGESSDAMKDVKVFKDMKTLTNYETVLFEGDFVPEKDGEYNVGMHIFSKVNDYLTILNASVEEVYHKDLAALSLEGTPEQSVGAASEFKAVIKNKGSEKVDRYKVQVVRLDGADRIVLGEKEVTETLMPNETAEIMIEATPDVEGEVILAALVVMDGDELIDNNLSNELVVNVSPEGTIPFNFVVVGEKETTNTRMPMGFIQTNTLSQSIYYSTEIGLTENVIVSRLAYEYTGQEVLNEEFELEVYMALTDKTEFEDEQSWVDLSKMTKVYSGKNTLNMGEGNLLNFNLQQNFKIETGKNLLVAVKKQGYGKKNFYPAAFRAYNKDWESPMRTLLFEGTQDYDFASGTDCSSFPFLPVLHMAIEKDGSGIEELVLGNQMWFDSANGNLVLNGVEAQSVSVYDITGCVVAQKTVETGAEVVQMNLNEGMYIARVKDVNGLTHVAKIRVAR